MHETDAKFELIYIAPVLAGEWIVGGCGRDRDCPAGGNRGHRERIQEYREQSQEVAENKGHNFFQFCKLRAFCAQFGTN